MKRKNLFIACILIIGGTLGGIVCYASDHPESMAYKMCTDIGLHFPKK